MPAMFWFILVHYIWRPFQPVAQLLVILYPGVLIFWLIMHVRIEHWRRMGKRAFWIASIGWPLTAIPILYFREQIFAPPLYVSAGESMAMLLLGTTTLVVAVVLAFQAEKKMPLRTLVGLPELEPHKNRQPLLNSGIYAKTRNPVYLVHWLLIFSAAAITGFVANWILFIIDCIVLPLMIRAEERELLNRYGSEFADYMSRVPRFFPKWTW
jgi:protein-S-isoprenylcysteine O-methyltransferase Ste14